ncbi:hypothetical protein CDAR_534681 [Caerostris darwini]|uniref:Uncharacterized protein n=1 Tax=Caerostris darwini TaxID=1538125 RepID=A0AAV4NNY6_9ARAC|nr:hypothetical protein CDAR_534681 [Caerostris darwini]
MTEGQTIQDENELKMSNQSTHLLAKKGQKIGQDHSIDQQVKKRLLPRALLPPFTYDGWDVYLNLHGRRSPRMGIICSDDFYQRGAYLI